MPKLTDEQIQKTLKNAIKDAVAFIEGEIAPDRVIAQQYFLGGTRLENEEGRSKVVATKCRDTVRALKPALMRVFLQSDRPVEFVPSHPGAAAAAEQATNYARYIFDKNDGFRVLHDVIHDALVKKIGIVKPYYEEVGDVEFDNLTGLPEEALAMLEADESIDSVDVTDGENGMFNAKISRTSKYGCIKFDSVPPEDFFFDRAAKTVKDCYVCGHSATGRVTDLVEMGFDLEEVLELAGDDSHGDEEQQERTGHDTDEHEGDEDPSMRRILITEAYMRMDIEGTGIAKRYKFICAGDKYEILDRELCDHTPFAIFECDPEPHTLCGRSIVDIITDDQDVATGLLRGLLDSISMANNPRAEVVEEQVNMDDLLNNEVGGVIRVKTPGMIREITIGANTAAVLPAMQFYDDAIRAKTGVVGAGMGLDVNALESQTAAGVRLADQVSGAVAELIARVMAEGGMRQLFEIIAQLARQHPNPEEMVRVDGSFVPVDPRSWTNQMEVVANVGLGTGKIEQRVMALGQMLQFQMAVFQGYGPSNGLITLTNIRNTQADMLKMAGVYNADRYLQPMDPQKEQMILQQQAAAKPPAQDPNAAYLEAERMKAQVRMQADQQKAQIDMAKAKADFQFRAKENAQADDLARDQMMQDLMLKVADLFGKYNVQLNPQQIMTQQEAPRA